MFFGHSVSLKCSQGITRMTHLRGEIANLRIGKRIHLRIHCSYGANRPSAVQIDRTHARHALSRVLAIRHPADIDSALELEESRFKTRRIDAFPPSSESPRRETGTKPGMIRSIKRCVEMTVRSYRLIASVAMMQSLTCPRAQFPPEFALPHRVIAYTAAIT